MPRAVSDFFLRYGAGSHYIQKLTTIRAWNFIAWALIAVGALAWAVFLTWKP